MVDFISGLGVGVVVMAYPVWRYARALMRAEDLLRRNGIKRAA